MKENLKKGEYCEKKKQKKTELSFGIKKLFKIREFFKFGMCTQNTKNQIFWYKIFLNMKFLIS